MKAPAGAGLTKRESVLLRGGVPTGERLEFPPLDRRHQLCVLGEPGARLWPE